MCITIAMFITNLISDEFAHVHIYATTLLCLFFWIKSNVKMSKFLTKIGRVRLQRPEIFHFLEKWTTYIH